MILREVDPIGEDRNDYTDGIVEETAITENPVPKREDERSKLSPGDVDYQEIYYDEGRLTGGTKG